MEINIHVIRYRKKIVFFLLLLLALFPILPYSIISIIIVAFTFFSIWLFWDEGLDNFRLHGIAPFLYNSGFFILLCLTLFYSEDYGQGLKTLQASISILILPMVLIYFQPKYLERERNLIYIVFVGANFLYVLLLINYMFDNVTEFCYPELSELSIFQKYYYAKDVSFDFLLWCSENVNKTYLFVHKAYISLSFLFASILIIHMLSKGRNPNYGKILLIIALITFLFFVVYVYSIMNIFLMAVLLPLFVFFNLKKRKFLKMFISSFIMLCCIFIWNIGLKWTTGSKIKAFQAQIELLKKEKQNDGILERGLLNECNIALVRNNWIFGIGIGDVQTKLGECYVEKKEENDYFQKAFFNKMNSHNYYYLLLQSGGLFLLISFLIFAFYNIKLSIKHKHYTYLFFLILIMSNLFTENMLSRMYGVVFFSLFNNLFFAEIIEKRKINGG